MIQFLPALLGGLLIGTSASVLLLFNGRVAGISGIAGGLFRPSRGEAGWRIAFLAGLIGGGFLLRAFLPDSFGAAAIDSPLLIVLAGLLVGYGTRLGNGCTSGHGICGISRGSMRGISATLMFMVTGVVTVFVVHNLLGGL